MLHLPKTAAFHDRQLAAAGLLLYTITFLSVMITRAVFVGGVLFAVGVCGCCVLERTAFPCLGSPSW